MKKISILAAIIFILLLNSSICKAEKIYYKDGRIIYGDIVYCGSNTVWIRYSYGSIGINTNDIDRIENDDGSISKYDTKSIINIFQTHLKQQQYNQALKLCDLLLESFPKDSKILYLHSMLNHKVGNLTQASQDYLSLIEQNSADATIFNNLGVIYANYKNHKKAIDFFTKATQEDANLIQAHHNLAQISMQTQDYTMAIKEYNKVVEFEPDNVAALFNLGLAYMNSGNSSKAKEKWEDVLSIIPEDFDAINALEYLKEIADNNEN